MPCAILGALLHQRGFIALFINELRLREEVH